MATATVPTKTKSERAYRPGVLAFCGAILILFARYPDAILHARFYAEDGAIFYATAYNYGWWRVLFSPYEGYLHLFPRLTACLALLVPLAHAPLVMNVVALTIEAIPVLLLLSPISRRLGSLRFRIVLAVLYLVVPNCGEVLLCVTESQWILALCALLIVLGLPPAKRVVASILYAITMFTGPFCIFLLPAAAWIYWRERSGWKRFLLGLTVAGAITQATEMIFAARAHPRIVISASAFVQIIGSQVYLGALLGRNLFGEHFSAPLAIVALGATAFLLWSFAQTNAYMRAFILFGFVVLLAVVAHPIVYPPPGKTAWEWLAMSNGTHYWFFPCLAFAWAIASAAFSRKKPLRLYGYFLSLLLLVGVVRDFRHPSVPDPHFHPYVQRFNHARQGETVTIPSRPYGWNVVLIRH